MTTTLKVLGALLVLIFCSCIFTVRYRYFTTEREETQERQELQSAKTTAYGVGFLDGFESAHTKAWIRQVDYLDESVECWQQDYGTSTSGGRLSLNVCYNVDDDPDAFLYGNNY